MKNNNEKSLRFFGLFFILVIVISWFIGAGRGRASLEPFLKKGGADFKVFEQVSNNVYTVWNEKEKLTKKAYLTFASAHGYGGEIILMVVSSLEGEIINSLVVDHRETYSFFKRVKKSQLFDQLKLKNYQMDFRAGADVDIVSGATYTVRGIVNAAKTGIRNIARYALKVDVPTKKKPRIEFGFSEVTLIVLFAFGFIQTLKVIKYKTIFRWISIISGLLLVGFVIKKPLSITFINKVLLGSFPAWQEHFYWYLLLILVLIPVFFMRFNLYCDRICPFGAMQEVISGISGTKKRRFKGLNFFKWVHRFAALAVVSLALIYRKPAVANYEIFGVFFNLIGSTFKFILLGIILLLSFFMVRPWCNLFCPVRILLDYIGIFRDWLRSILGWNKSGSNL